MLGLLVPNNDRINITKVLLTQKRKQQEASGQVFPAHIYFIHRFHNLKEQLIAHPDAFT
jgi:hypothetical protein